MKSFQSYVFELNKPYEFRIKLATIEPKGEVMEQIKNALNTFQLESISAVKSLPIQEHREFPKYGACECLITMSGSIFSICFVTSRRFVGECNLTFAWFARECHFS
jgi:hypothetical protein